MKIDTEQDIEHARMRMIYEDPADYAAWRERMGLAKPAKARDDPVMQARLARLFHQLSASMDAATRPPRRKDFAYTTDEALREYGTQPLGGLSPEAMAIGRRAAE